MPASVDWSSLPSDLVNRIADYLLATTDVDCYMDFRAICSTWRSATTNPKNSPDRRFHPRRWVVIDEVSYSLEFQHRTRLFVNTATDRVLRKDLSMLRDYYVIATTHGGFFVLADKKQPHATCVLNPFTGYLVRFMAPMVTEQVNDAAFNGSSLVLFCDSCRTIYMANVDSRWFSVYGNQYPYDKLGLLGLICTGHDVRRKMFNLMTAFAVHPSEMLTVYPFEGAVDHYGARNTGRCFLVECAGQMLMIIKLQERMEVFKVDNDMCPPGHVKSIGNRAIFLGYRQCLSVNADKFQMVEANCIYYVKCIDSRCAIYKYDLSDKKEEMISVAINTIYDVFLFDAHPPSTIIQLLSSYTFNVWGSELETAKTFEELPDVIPDTEDFGLSPYLEDLESGD